MTPEERLQIGQAYDRATKFIDELIARTDSWLITEKPVFRLPLLIDIGTALPNDALPRKLTNLVEEISELAIQDTWRYLQQGLINPDFTLSAQGTSEYAEFDEKEQAGLRFLITELQWIDQLDPKSNQWSGDSLSARFASAKHLQACLELPEESDQNSIADDDPVIDRTLVARLLRAAKVHSGTCSAISHLSRIYRKQALEGVLHDLRQEGVLSLSDTGERPKNEDVKIWSTTVSIKQIAHLTQCSRSTIYRWIKNGKLEVTGLERNKRKVRLDNLNPELAACFEPDT